MIPCVLFFTLFLCCVLFRCAGYGDLFVVLLCCCVLCCCVLFVVVFCVVLRVLSERSPAVVLGVIFVLV